MSIMTRARRGLATFAAAAVASGGLIALGAAPAQADPATTVGEGTIHVDDATFTWGLNGYAQVGIFGAWTYKDLTGNATQLVGSVSGGSQNEYLVDPVPATSFPTSKAGQTPNAIKFTDGEGTVDTVTGERTIEWEGSYTVNAYPAAFGAPDEIYADPILTVDEDGSGTLTANFTLGAGIDMEGNPVEAQDFGRLPLMTFGEDSGADEPASDFRVTPDYQGVVNGLAAQNTSCTTAGGATGWWGSWPQEFIDVIGETAVGPHFYSTGCGGLQDNKPALPFDVTYTENKPTVTVSETELPDGVTTEVTVTGENFDPSLAIGTRPPFSGKQSGAYIAFGRYADTWRPSEGAPSSARTNPAAPNGNGVGVKWAVPAASFPGSGQSPDNPAYTILGEDGSFSTTIQVNSEWLASASGNFGIYTYTGGGPNVSSYETYTPLTFVSTPTKVTVQGIPATATVGDEIVAEIQVKKTATAAGAPQGTVEVREGDTVVATGELAGGKATVELPRDLDAGKHQFRVHYLGGSGFAPSESGLRMIRIERATPEISLEVEDTTFGTAAEATITVTAPEGVAPEGKVKLTGHGKTVTAMLEDGTATIALPRALAAGEYELQAQFVKSPTLNAATTSADLAIAAVDPKSVTFTVDEAPTSTTAGEATVRANGVASALPKPTGEFTVELKKGTETITLTGDNAGGVATVELPALEIGTWKVTVTIEADGNYTQKSSKVYNLQVTS